MNWLSPEIIAAVLSGGGLLRFAWSRIKPPSEPTANFLTRSAAWVSRRFRVEGLYFQSEETLKDRDAEIAIAYETTNRLLQGLQLAEKQILERDQVIKDLRAEVQKLRSEQATAGARSSSEKSSSSVGTRPRRKSSSRLPKPETKSDTSTGSDDA